MKYREVKAERELLEKVCEWLRKHTDDPIDVLRRAAASDDEPQSKPGAEFYKATRGECLAAILENHHLPPEEP